MKFLVVLICVTANYFWQRDLDRFDDTWFFRLRQLIDRFAANLAERYGKAWILGLLLIFGVPIGVLAVFLILVNGVLFGLLTLLLHIIVLLLAFDRIHPGLLAQGYLEHWRRGDLQGCIHYLEQELDYQLTPIPGDLRELHSVFCRRYIYSCFEKMFVMFFWYIITGPIGVLFAYVCYQHRDGDSGQPDDKAARIVQQTIEFLEWAPLRLLGLTFSLVGDFENCFSRLRQTRLQNELPTDATVYEFAVSALGLNLTVATSPVSVPEDRPGEMTNLDKYKNQGALEVDALQALMERSQIVWLCVVALLTIFGVQL